MSPEAVARHQKGRLEGAMVEAVTRHGLASTTLRELVALAGVSKSTFYQHFSSKQECFLSTFDAIVQEASRQVGEAYLRPGDFREKLTAGLSAFMELAARERAAASLVAVESLTLGAAGIEHRERASRDFELLIQQSFDHSDLPREVSPLTVRAIVAGIRGVTYRELRTGEPERLPGMVEPLVGWALSYGQPDSEATRRAVEAAGRPGAPAAAEAAGNGDEPVLTWDEPPDSRLSRRHLTQRQRIVRAAARVVVEKGYETLSIPAISGAAGVSNQTFYENFSSKREAFLEAFAALGAEALGQAAAAFDREPEWAAGIGAALRALLEHIAASPLFAQLAFFELPTAGPTALDQADAILDSFTAYLGPSVAPAELGAPLSPTVQAAIASGIWAAIQHEIAHGRRVALPQLAPEAARLAVAPFGAAQ